MADDFTITTRDGDKDLRAREISTGLYSPKQEVAPWEPTPTGAPVTFTIGTSSASGEDGGGTYNIPDDTTHVLVSVEDFAVRVTEDSTTAPTSTLGLLLPVGFIGELARARHLNYIGIGGTARVNLAPRKYV